MSSRPEDIATHFAIQGRPISSRPSGHGHIHDSYLVELASEQNIARVLLQRVNLAVFPHPEFLMENLRRVTEHVRAKLVVSDPHDAERRALTCIPTADGQFLHLDHDGSHWRMFRFVERTTTYETVASAWHAEQAGHAFGAFQDLLRDLPAPRLHEIIPAFHDTPRRFDALDQARRLDPYRRAAEAEKEIVFAQSQRPMAGLLIDAQQVGELPERVVHNDAKISNVLFDDKTGEALCVVDLDTVMPGLALFDFGDMVRTMTAHCREDETDLDRVEIDLPIFEALVRGYIDATRPFLTPAERRRLVLASHLITLEQGVRFLTDFLSGDTYYGAARPRHNLDRCRVQFKLVRSIMQREEDMARIVESC